jgi:hypothetical protein
MKERQAVVQSPEELGEAIFLMEKETVLHVIK